VKVPDWTGDWCECGPLQARYVRRLRAWPHRVLVGIEADGPADHLCNRSEGETAERLLRRAIVAAVIAHLEACR